MTDATTFNEMATVFFLSAMPIVELRGAIPLGIGVFNMPVPLVMILAFFGNLLPVFAVYGVGQAWLDLMARKKGFLQRLTDGTVARARRAFMEKSARHGAWALPLFVAIPLPMTGAVTGALAAFLFGVPFRRALPLLALGVAIADVIVTLVVTGSVGALGFLAGL